MSSRDDFEHAYIATLGKDDCGMKQFLECCRLDDDHYLLNLSVLDRVSNMLATGCINGAYWAWKYQEGRFGVQMEARHGLH